jgi:ElaB/YqjD/DUF883 family membrane-anchored ribosome-binding protein
MISGDRVSTLEHPEPAMSEVNTDKLLEDLRAVIRDAEELLRTTTGQTGEHIAQARAKAEASLHAAKAMLHSLGDAARVRARDTARCADTYVRSNPWAAMGAGAALGFFIGMMLGQRPGRPD